MISIAVDYAADKPRVLIVDDSAMNRELLTEMLQSDYYILEAKNGQICIDTMQEFHGDIALVLLDINMPVLDGFDVLKMMNASHTIEDIPVIMISSEDSEAPSAGPMRWVHPTTSTVPLTRGWSAGALIIPSSSMPSSGGWCAWFPTRYAPGRKTPPCWWVC